MAVCSIDKERRLKLNVAVASLIKEQVENKKPINIQEVAQRIYDKILSVSNDRAKALSYAMLVPSIANKAFVLNQDIQDYIVDNDIDTKEIAKLARKLNTSPSNTVLNVIAEFLGQEPLSKKFENAEEKLKAQKKLDAENKSAESSTILNFSAKPNTLFSTTGQQSIPGTDTPDPSMSFYYDILKRLDVNNLNTEEGVVYDGVDGGLHISIVSGQVIEDSEMYTKDADKRDEYNKNFFLVLTDKNGNTVYFNQNYKVVDKQNGKPIYYPLRTDVGSTAQPTEVSDQLTALKDAARYIKQDPLNRKVVNKITGKSIGYINTNNKVPYTALDTIQNNSDFVFIPHNGKLYLSVKNGTQGPIEVIMKPFSQERANLIASLIVDDIYQDGQLMSVSEKYRILNSWLDNGKGIYFTTKNKNLVIKINGAEVNLADKANAKTQIADQLTKEFTVGDMQVKEKFKAKLNLLNDKIPMFDLVESNGQLTYSENLIPYQDYLKQVTLARVFINENNTVTPLNGYFTYDLGNRVESKPEVAKQETGTQQASEVKPGVEDLFNNNPELANAVYSAMGLNNINESEITYTDEEGNPCAKFGLTNTTSGTGWKIVKDFKGQPKHSQGGVDISISDKGVSMRRGGKDIKAKYGLLIPNNN